MKKSNSWVWIRKAIFVILAISIISLLTFNFHIQNVFACYSWSIGQRVGLKGGSQIRVGSGLGYTIHTIVPNDDMPQFYGPDGKELAPELMGYFSPDFYGLYLEGSRGQSERPESECECHAELRLCGGSWRSLPPKCNGPPSLSSERTRESQS